MEKLAINFDNSFSSLPADFYSKTFPEKMPNLELIRLNKSLCDLLDLSSENLASRDGVKFLGGEKILKNSIPLAQAYAGHQFGNFVPSLGDGRAILLGELIGKDGIRRDIQLKGSGRTPFSRMGDGRAGLGPILREYIVSEAMNSFRIPTTRTLAALFTGETVQRDSIIPGALLTRVAKSHIRVGTFEYFSCRNQHENIKILANYVIRRHYPQLNNSTKPYLAFLNEVIKNQAELIANWMSVGFIHGVMNTDNMTVSGETIDFGPCAFMDSFNKNQVYSSIDVQGRYSYENQPLIATWNLSRLAETILPLIDNDIDKSILLAQESLEEFSSIFKAKKMEIMGAKIGINYVERGDEILIESLFQMMEDGQADFTLTFSTLSDAIEKNSYQKWKALFSNIPDDTISSWLKKWEKRLMRSSLEKKEVINHLKITNPRIIPRNHLIEACISEALTGNLGQFNEFVKALEDPYTQREEIVKYSKPPEPWEIVQETFCGT